jgi:alanyl-tRNA synthetase
MDSSELRKKFLDFFKEKGHTIIPGAPLIPENDPTVLFTTAGMHPLVPFLLGEKHPAGKRLANVQKCIRTGDIDEVGDDVHLTFFEMLGNWSLGDYFKKEAIEWSFEFLIKWLKIPLGKLAVSCFLGDKDAPKDTESAKIWQGLGISKERIVFLPKKDNWWGPAGKTGPCGPDTEMFFWAPSDAVVPKHFDSEDKRWVEIWNDVLMGYVKNEKEEYLEAPQKNVDTGMGLERVLAVLCGYNNVYDTDLFSLIIKKIEEITGKEYKGENVKAFRIIADHLKAATFILAEGIEPSNIEQGYILRRLIRRAVRYAKQLGVKDIFSFKIAEAVIKIYKNAYPELFKNKDFVYNQLIKEEERFEETLERGLREFKSQTAGLKSKTIPGKIVFDLYQSYGFPLELTKEMAKEERLLIDEAGFNKEFQKHQDISRVGAEQKFKGGLADHSETVTKYHTATHLLLAALRQALGDHVFQKGSNITGERLRFDFSHSSKMTPEEIKKTEEIINKKIKEGLKIEQEEMSLEEAKKQGAMGVFGEKYGKKVKVYTISDFSKEICGGPHVNNTSELGRFKIIKEESSSSGVRRIKAILK